MNFERQLNEALQILEDLDLLLLEEGEPLANAIAKKMRSFEKAFGAKYEPDEAKGRVKKYVKDEAEKLRKAGHGDKADELIEKAEDPKFIDEIVNAIPVAESECG